jgi:hypothetical protein
MVQRSRRASQILAAVVLLAILAARAQAHHGGLGIEGDVIDWSLKVDQWQQEHLADGHRIKFLAYPRTAIVNRTTRLVFEVQSVTTGHYVGGLMAAVVIRTPRGEEHTLEAPETPGVSAYYEALYEFHMTGAHTIMFRTQANGQRIMASFRQQASANPLFGDWQTVTGNGVVLAAFVVTWVGAVLALQRRLLPEIAPF